MDRNYFLLFFMHTIFFLFFLQIIFFLWLKVFFVIFKFNFNTLFYILAFWLNFLFWDFRLVFEKIILLGFHFSSCNLHIWSFFKTICISQSVYCMLRRGISWRDTCNHNSFGRFFTNERISKHQSEL